MFALSEFELIDFGRGRRLERFGPWRVDRPCPTVAHIEPRTPEAWEHVDARFERTGDGTGEWSVRRPPPEPWVIRHGPLAFLLKLAPAGQLGVFPEQASNWQWIAEQVGKAGHPASAPPGPAPPTVSPDPAGVPNVLNLFAYTGGSTLAAAAAGAEVTHVDAAANTVAWARRNAQCCGLADKPVRWIVEDAHKFVKRELKRGHRYDAVILDPPSYGHGPRGEVWRLSKHLPGMLESCAELTAGRRRFMLLTCHTPGFPPQRLQRMLDEALGDAEPGDCQAQWMTIRTSSGKQMPCGVAVRWSCCNSS